MNLTTTSRKLSPFCSCLLLALLPLIYNSPARSQAAQTPSVSGTPLQTTISVRSELVALPVRVTDTHNHFVPGLRQQDFQVYEEGRPQTITLFQQEDAPVTVGLVVDHSRSMGRKLAEVSAAVSAFSHSSNPQDEMFVVDFNDDVWLQILGGKPFTHDPHDLEQAIAAVSARGRTALYDAIAEAINHMRYGHWEKKALILVSDGGDNASHQKFPDILTLAQRSQVQIYSIVLIGADEEENPAVLKRLCKSTGGLAYFPDAKQSIASISNQIARDLREQYTIGFAPQNQTSSASFRKIQLKVSAAGQGKLNLRYRPGYFATGDQKAAAPSAKGAS